MRIIPPGSGIVHQVNLEYLARVVFNHEGFFYPDSLVGTDSHTTMIDGLGVLGWGELRSTFCVVRPGALLATSRFIFNRLFLRGYEYTSKFEFRRRFIVQHSRARSFCDGLKPTCLAAMQWLIWGLSFFLRLVIGVGGIEAEAVMLGQPISMVLPEVVGYKMYGSPDKFITSTDIVLTVTKVNASISMELLWTIAHLVERYLCFSSTSVKWASWGSLWSFSGPAWLGCPSRTEPPSPTCVQNMEPPQLSFRWTMSASNTSSRPVSDWQVEAAERICQC